MLFLSVSVTKICIKYMYTYISKQKLPWNIKFICIKSISNFILILMEMVMESKILYLKPIILYFLFLELRQYGIRHSWKWYHIIQDIDKFI